MEQLRCIEKQLRIKAFSNANLEKEDEMEPQASAKRERRMWLNACIKDLHEIVRWRSDYASRCT
jgi:CCR4-NOT transcriptional regulation complex NOT5 subunit